MKRRVKPWIILITLVVVLPPATKCDLNLQPVRLISSFLNQIR
jgi:hypothetical protein